MAKNNNNRFNQGYRKPKKADKQAKPLPFNDDLKRDKNKKVVMVFAIIIVIVMVGTLIVPYLGSSTTTYSYSDEKLKASEQVQPPNYTPQKISVGQTYNRSDKTYYVFFGDESSITSKLSSTKSTPSYYVSSQGYENATLTTNKKNAVKLPQKPDQIKVKNKYSMMKIVNGKAVLYLQDAKAIDAYLKKIK